MKDTQLGLVLSTLVGQVLACWLTIADKAVDLMLQSSVHHVAILFVAAAVHWRCGMQRFLSLGHHPQAVARASGLLKVLQPDSIHRSVN